MLVMDFPAWGILRQEHYEEMVNTALENVLFAQ